ncbi:histidine kinase [Pontibacter harenae]|uniref:histidine kinase n=1 Tax=Pontibacter harenae TaxID=2894083 RepID=UPI001E2A7C16|nr:histidine kinase [Pontibacter harenae]MCC9165540.1 histidine kinase [Pontibacter harenae]
MNEAQVDLQQLRIKHILFKSKVRSVLYGGTYDEFFFSSSGPIGTWFSAVGRVKYASVPEIIKLSQIHNALSLTAAKLFQLYKRGLIEQAHEGLKEIDKSSDLFLSLLARLETRLAAT